MSSTIIKINTKLFLLNGSYIENLNVEVLPNSLESLELENSSVGRIYYNSQSKLLEVVTLNSEKNKVTIPVGKLPYIANIEDKLLKNVVSLESADALLSKELNDLILNNSTFENDFKAYQEKLKKELEKLDNSSSSNNTKLNNIDSIEKSNKAEEIQRLNSLENKSTETNTKCDLNDERLSNLEFKSYQTGYAIDDLEKKENENKAVSIIRSNNLDAKIKDTNDSINASKTNIDKLSKTVDNVISEKGMIFGYTSNDKIKTYDLIHNFNTNDIECMTWTRNDASQPWNVSILDTEQYDNNTIKVSLEEPRYLKILARKLIIGPEKINYKHGMIINDRDGNPGAIVIGSYASGGKEPWNIRGKKLWIAVSTASHRFKNISLAGQADLLYNVPEIADQNENRSLADINIGPDKQGYFVSSQSTEEHINSHVVIGTPDQTSKEKTDLLLKDAHTNNSQYAASVARSIILKDNIQMDLPRIEILMRIYQSRHVINMLDPTLKDYQSFGLSDNEWGFGSNDGSFVWSSSEYTGGMEWNINSNGSVGSNMKHFKYGIIGALELDA